MSSLRRWWEQPDPYDWTTNFLRQRGLLHPVQTLMAMVNASALLIPLSGLLDSHQSAARAAVAVVAAGVFTAACFTFWLTRWPTRRQSIFLVAVGMACTTGWSFLEVNTTVATLACAAMAATGAYVAFFHGPKLLTLNSVLAMVLTVVATLRLGRESGIQAATAAFWLMSFLNVVMPLAIAGTTRAMGRYVVRGDQDPLTGLLNRRGFIDAIRRQLTSVDSKGAYLTMQMVDLDHFKQVNDTYGHAAGDQILTAVAEALLRHSPPSSTICRAGGEEFLIAVVSNSGDEAEHVAAGVCAAISTLSPTVTASVGSTYSAFEHLVAPQAVEELIEAADLAMYAAKRNGGNRVHYA